MVQRHHYLLFTGENGSMTNEFVTIFIVKIKSSIQVDLNVIYVVMSRVSNPLLDLICVRDL